MYEVLSEQPGLGQKSNAVRELSDTPRARVLLTAPSITEKESFTLLRGRSTRKL
jgi:hypothetical protein